MEGPEPGLRLQHPYLCLAAGIRRDNEKIVSRTDNNFFLYGSISIHHRSYAFR